MVRVALDGTGCSNSKRLGGYTREGDAHDVVQVECDGEGLVSIRSIWAFCGSASASCFPQFWKKVAGRWEGAPRVCQGWRREVMWEGGGELVWVSFCFKLKDGTCGYLYLVS